MTIKYGQKGARDDLRLELKNQVEKFFSERKLSIKGDYRIYLKLIILYAMYLGPFAFLFATQANSMGIVFLIAVIMGIGKAGIGLNIMHDSVHGSISYSKKVNQIIGHTSCILLGANLFNWEASHNEDHHIHTNVFGVDHDLNAGMGLLRMSQYDKLKWFHKFQHIYASFLYLLSTITWIVYKDFPQTARFIRNGKIIKKQIAKRIIYLVLTKAFYFSLFIFLPMKFLAVSPVTVIAVFVIMHLTAGGILSFVFQPAHIVTKAKDVTVNEENRVESSWAKHQLETTANFANNNRFLSWYFGGLNFQIEHHLFPHISHIHYRSLKEKVVKPICKKFGIRYNDFPTFREAVLDHFRLLKILGTA